MTVEELHKKLTKFLEEGHGKAKILLSDSRSGVTEEISGGAYEVSVFESGQDIGGGYPLDDILENEEEYVTLYVG